MRSHSIKSVLYVENISVPLQKKKIFCSFEVSHIKLILYFLPSIFRRADISSRKEKVEFAILSIF